MREWNAIESVLKYLNRRVCPNACKQKKKHANNDRSGWVAFETKFMPEVLVINSNPACL